MMKKPSALSSGDLVRVVAPASPFDRVLFERGIAELEALGFEPSFDERVFNETGYVAGFAEDRAADLIAAWEDPKVAGIFAVRGGYGSSQVLPLLDPAVARLARKPLIGCSDLTSLLIFLAASCELVSFHGPMLVNLAAGDSGYDRLSLLGAISTVDPLGELCPANVEVLNEGEARGVLLGGTLTQILASLSTPFAFRPPDGYVLLLDDVGESPYRIDRMLTQLVQTGLLFRASAVICSEFPNCQDNDGRSAKSVVGRILKEFKGPILFNFPTGHTVGQLWTLPLGVMVAVSTAPTPRVIIEESSVQ